MSMSDDELEILKFLSSPQANSMPTKEVERFFNWYMNDYGAEQQQQLDEEEQYRAETDMETEGYTETKTRG